MPLRKPQVECLEASVAAYDNGFTRQLAVMATGTGKTVVFSHIPDSMRSRLPGQMWVLAHREELIDQAVAKLRHYNPALLVDKEMAEHYANPMADVIVSCVASIGRKGTKRVDRFDWNAVDKIIIDEAHHSTASTYQNFLELTGALEPNSKKLLLGVTATPQRGDGKALAELYQKIVYAYTMRQAIEDGWLVHPRGYRVNTKISLDEVKSTAGDFQIGDLADAVNNPARNALTVKAWAEKGSGRQTVAFTVDIQHAMDLAATFREAGVKAAAIWGNDPDRALKLKQHREGVITVLCNCGVLTEGYDDWQIGCILLARPTKSATLYAQMVGRGTRLEDGTGNLLDCVAAGRTDIKRDCLIIDICDSTRHNLQTVPTLMGLDKDLDLKGASALDAARSIEAAQEDNPHIDLRGLKEFDNLTAYIEDINLFDVQCPAEISAGSQLAWYNTSDGGYALLLPNRGRMVIQQNMLDQFEITALINGQKYRGQRNSLAEALAAGDGIIEKVCAEDLKILRREEAWHSGWATPPQKGLIRKLYKGKKFPFCVCKEKPGIIILAEPNQQCAYCKAVNNLTKGQATRLITSANTKKVSVAA